MKGGQLPNDGRYGRSSASVPPHSRPAPARAHLALLLRANGTRDRSHTVTACLWQMMYSLSSVLFAWSQLACWCKNPLCPRPHRTSLRALAQHMPIPCVTECSRIATAQHTAHAFCLLALQFVHLPGGRVSFCSINCTFLTVGSVCAAGASPDCLAPRVRTPPTPRTKLPTIVRTRHSWLPVCTVFCHAHAVPASVCAFRDHQVFGTIVYGTVHIVSGSVTPQVYDA